MKTQSNDPKAVAEQLRPLAGYFPKVTKGQLAKLAWRIWQLEATGATHFGGADVLAWWLVQRCQPPPALTKATIRRLQRMCGGSQKSLDLLVAMEVRGRPRPRRLQPGWTFEQIHHYLRLLELERKTVQA